jgi:hypothetical protein
MHDFIKSDDSGFAWTKKERGSFWTNFFPPDNIPVISHKISYSSRAL